MRMAFPSINRVRLRAVALLLLLGLVITAVAEELYVFYPVTVRPQVFQKKLSSACRGVQVLVFGRYQDFISRVEIDKPTAILAHPQVVRQCANYSLQLEGARGDSLTEPYVLLWVRDESASFKEAATDVGIVNALGRKQTEAFVNSLITPAPQIEIVTKVEDLLPLMIFEMVKGIVIPSRQVDYFKETSQLKFAATPLPGAGGGIVALGVRQGAPAADLEELVHGFDQSILETLGASKWK